MGWAEALFGATNPFATWVNTNRNAVRGIGAGLATGRDFGEGLGYGARYAAEGAVQDDAYATQQKAEAERARQLQATTDWLKRMGQDQLATLIEGGVDPAQAIQLYKATQPQGVGEAPSSVREWEYYNALPPEQQGAYLRMKRANPYLDIGTGFVQPDPVNPGSVAGPTIVKDNFTPAYDTASGTASAKVDEETKAAFASLNSKLPGLKVVVSELGDLAKTATYTATGQLIDSAMREAGMEPSDAAVARTKYIAMVDNQILPLLRDTFGAAFTAKEGETLRATLGDPNKSPAEKQVILEAFIEQKTRDLEALQSRLPSQGTTYTYNPETGELE